MQEHPEDAAVLAEIAGLGKVTMCGCGVISLHLGSITLRLEAKALAQMEQLLDAALDQLCELKAQLQGAPEAVGVIQ